MSRSEDFINNKIFDRQSEWLDEFAREELIRYIYDETRIATLAHLYKQGVHEAALVATICDQVIDRSGRLLGEVRNVVRNEKEQG